jgi:hypothetical protein
MRSRIIGIGFSTKNGKKVSANNLKITFNIIIWPVLHTSTVPFFVRLFQILIICSKII